MCVCVLTNLIYLSIIGCLICLYLFLLFFFFVITSLAKIWNKVSSVAYVFNTEHIFPRYGINPCFTERLGTLLVTQTHSRCILRWARSWLVPASLTMIGWCVVISISADTKKWSPKPILWLEGGLLAINNKLFTQTFSTDLNLALKRYLSDFKNVVRAPRWAIFQHT